MTNDESARSKQRALRNDAIVARPLLTIARFIACGRSIQTFLIYIS
jgi:hypothetical protein